MTAFTYADAKREFKFMRDPGDPWGSAMQWWFAVAESLTFTHGSDVPAHWEFRPSPIQTETDQDSLEAEFCDNADPDDLERFGNLLCRYADALKCAGYSY